MDSSLVPLSRCKPFVGIYAVRFSYLPNRYSAVLPLYKNVLLPPRFSLMLDIRRISADRSDRQNAALVVVGDYVIVNIYLDSVLGT